MRLVRFEQLCDCDDCIEQSAAPLQIALNPNEIVGLGPSMDVTQEGKKTKAIPRDGFTNIKVKEGLQVRTIEVIGTLDQVLSKLQAEGAVEVVTR